MSLLTRARPALRRAALRAIVSPPVYPVATRLPRTALLAARAAFRTGRDASLEATLERLAQRERGVAPALVLRADLDIFRGRYERALDHAEAAARANPSHPGAAARVVKLSYRVRELVEAEQAAAAAVVRFPRAGEVLWQAALACDNAGQYERLAAAFSARPDPQPGDLLPVVRQLGVAAARAGQVDAAVGWYRESIVLLASAGPPAHPPATTRLAGLGAHHAVHDLCQALDGAGVPFFFAAGTALGLVRQGRPLGADGDIDVGIFDADWDRDALIDLFRRHRLFDLDLHPQTHKVGLRHRGGSPVDIFRFYEQDGRVWHDGVFVRWHNSPFSVVRRRIGGVAVPLPGDTERYLTENYGDWRTPFPGFDAFTDDAPNLEVTWPAYQRLHFARRAFARLAAGDRAAAERELGLAGEPELARTIGTSVQV